MDDTDDDARYPPNPQSSSYHHHHRRPKLPVRNPSSAPSFYHHDYYDSDDADDYHQRDQDDDEDDDERQQQQHNPVRRPRVRQAGEYDDDEDEEEESGARGKRRRMEKSALGFEFVPRPKPPPVPASTSKSPFGGPSGSSRTSPADWSEQSTFALLDEWGDRFLQLGRKSLRSDEWAEVAKRVSQVSKSARTDAQCRNRLDTLKKKYKKEKMKMMETGGSMSKWVYFKKMEALLESPPAPRQPALACGLDAGEYVFMNPNVYLNLSNGLDEMRDSPGISESIEGDDEDESDGLPPKRREEEGEENGGHSSSFRLLADSIQKFGEIYEKIENNKRQQMLELEKMRVEFHRDLELQKRQILERAQAEIAKIRQGDDEEIDVSVENVSG